VNSTIGRLKGHKKVERGHFEYFQNLKIQDFEKLDISKILPFNYSNMKNKIKSRFLFQVQVGNEPLP